MSDESDLDSYLDSLKIWKLDLDAVHERLTKERQGGVSNSPFSQVVLYQENKRKLSSSNNRKVRAILLEIMQEQEGVISGFFQISLESVRLIPTIQSYDLAKENPSLMALLNNSHEDITYQVVSNRSKKEKRNSFNLFAMN